MSKLKGVFPLVAAPLFATLQAAPVQALPTTFVDQKLGSDANACTVTAPCKSLNKALTVTDAGGLIFIVGDGVINTGPITITKGVAIQGTGHEAQFLQPSGNAITINDGGAGATILMSDIKITGLGTGNAAIYVQNAGRLELKSVREAGFAYGLYYTPQTSSSTNHLVVNDSTFKGNKNLNVLVAPTGAGGVSATFTNVSVNEANYGLQFDGTKGTGRVTATVTDSTLSFFNNAAVNVISGPTLNGNSSANVTLTRTVISNSSQFGILTTGAGAEATINDCTLTHMAVGIHITSGEVLTMQNNFIGATTQVQGTLTPVTPR